MREVNLREGTRGTCLEYVNSIVLPTWGVPGCGVHQGSRAETCPESFTQCPLLLGDSVGEHIQAFSDFLFYVIESHALLSELAVMVFDSVSGGVEVLPHSPGYVY